MPGPADDFQSPIFYCLWWQELEDATKKLTTVAGGTTDGGDWMEAKGSTLTGTIDDKFDDIKQHADVTLWATKGIVARIRTERQKVTSAQNRYHNAVKDLGSHVAAESERETLKAAQTQMERSAITLSHGKLLQNVYKDQRTDKKTRQETVTQELEKQHDISAEYKHLHPSIVAAAEAFAMS